MTKRELAYKKDSQNVYRKNEEVNGKVYRFQKEVIFTALIIRDKGEKVRRTYCRDSWNVFVLLFCGFVCLVFA